MQQFGNRRSAMRGFTLVELMVVVAIIAILASIALPKLNTYVRTAETSEADTIMGRIATELGGYMGSRDLSYADLITTTYLDANGGTRHTLDTDAATSGLETVLPQLALPTGHEWTYEVWVNTDATNEGFCIQATWTDGTDSYNTYFSSVAVEQFDWESNSSRIHYVTEGTQNTTAPSTGPCASTGGPTSWF